MPEGSYYRRIGQEALANKKEGTPQNTPETKGAESANKYRQLGQEALRAYATRKQQEAAAEKPSKWNLKEVGKMGLGVVGGGSALGFLSVNKLTKKLLRKVKGTGDFVNSWEWMEQTILGTRQRG